MAIIKGLEWTFNTVANEYDKWNPTYVPELYNDIFKYKQINQSSNVLEIGIGTGQATEPILQTGCTLTAIEIGDKLAEFSRKKFSQYDNFSVVNMPFQDVECEDHTYDFIYSARAFHWIPEEIGYSKVYDLLKSGGVFARFANHPFKDKGREEIHVALQKIYAVYMPGTLSDVEYSEEAAKGRADIAKKYGFVDIDYKLYHRTRTFTATEYVSLLGTYSDHVAIKEQIRLKFFAEIQKAIEDLGNRITLYDTISLQLARKP
jgi:ubiquinone/menaquinone biosynthesis C-methylase UbiE